MRDGVFRVTTQDNKDLIAVGTVQHFFDDLQTVWTISCCMGHSCMAAVGCGEERACQDGDLQQTRAVAAQGNTTAIVETWSTLIVSVRNVPDTEQRAGGGRLACS